jgi:hypothetical protein
MNEQEKIYNELLIFYGRITFLTILIPIVVAIWYYKQLNKPLKIFFYFLVATLIIGLLEQVFIQVASYTKILTPFLKYFKIEDTNFYQIVYFLKNYIFLSWFFINSYSSSTLRIWVKYVSILLIFASLVNYFFIEGYHVYGHFNPAVNNLYCFLIPTILLWYVYNNTESKVPLSKNPFFWINLGYVVQNLFTLFFELVGDKLHQTDFILFCQLALGRNIIAFIGFVSCAVGFYYARYTKYMPKATV